jgi:2-oxoglutarate dehydrogenase E2 component (dihydrolipoamide succinyltransferase)
MSTGTVVDVVMPQMGVSVSEGTISRWLKAEGETIEKDETILEISTDKVDTEVPSPASGTVSKIFIPEGDTVDVGTKLAEISSGDAGAGSAAPAAPAEAAPAAPAEPAPQLEMTPPPPAAPPSTNGNSHTTAPAAPSGGDTRFVSPVVARIAAEKGIDVSQVPGTGSGGRVTKKDILAFIEGGVSTATPAPVVAAAEHPSVPLTSATPAAAATPSPSTPAAPAAGFTGGERVQNFNPMRKAIAKHMIESVTTSAHVTSTVEVDMTNVVNMRNQVKDEILSSWGVKVTFTHFVCRAIIDAIASWPLINAEIRGDSAVIKSYVNLGIAVALDNGEGLIVPVVKNAEEKNLVGLARSVNDLANRARTKKLSPDDVTGGTITLTNPGIFGAIHGTPIINQPQVAIVDTEAIVKRPVVVTDEHGNDSIAIRSMMNLCISYDHRLIDGAYAVQFLAHIKRNLQEWDLARFTG